MARKCDEDRSVDAVSSDFPRNSSTPDCSSRAYFLYNCSTSTDSDNPTRCMLPRDDSINPYTPDIRISSLTPTPSSRFLPRAFASSSRRRSESRASRAKCTRRWIRDVRNRISIENKKCSYRTSIVSLVRPSVTLSLFQPSDTSTIDGTLSRIRFVFRNSIVLAFVPTLRARKAMSTCCACVRRLSSFLFQTVRRTSNPIPPERNAVPTDDVLAI